MPKTLLEGAEPYTASGGEGSALVLHGFTGTPRSMRPLAEALAAAGFSVDLPLLPGHGTTTDDLLPLRYDDWLAAAESAYGRLAATGGPVVALGLSMGGTLCLSLAGTRPEIAGLVLINPMVAPPATGFLGLLRRAADGGTETIPSIGSDVAKRGVSGGGYDATPVRPLLSLCEATGAVAARLSSMSAPLLLFSSREDHVVPGESSDLLERTYGGPVERVVLERSYHLATLDHDADEVFERSVSFAEKVCRG